MKFPCDGNNLEFRMFVSSDKRKRKLQYRISETVMIWDEVLKKYKENVNESGWKDIEQFEEKDEVTL